MIHEVKSLYICKKLMYVKGFIDILALGNCMEPFLHEHDILRVIPADTFCEGQVVICYDGSLKAHRVIAVDFDSCLITTKGDKSFNIEMIDVSNVMGVVIGAYRDTRWIWFEYSNQDREIAKLSKAVNEFYKCCGSVEKTLLSDEYRTLLLYIEEVAK